MDDEVKKLIGEQYAKLPPGLQQAIQSSSLHTQVAAIGAKNQLHIDQVGLLEEEVIMLMMGFTEPLEFAGHLHEQVHVDAIAAQKIATEVNQEILLPIRERLESEAAEPEAQIVEEPAKSVVMPSRSASAPSASLAPAPLSTDMQINAPASIAAKINTSSNTSLAANSGIRAPLHEADVMLTEPTVSLPPIAAKNEQAPTVEAAPNAKVAPPVPPPSYKADPYREPLE